MTLQITLRTTLIAAGAHKHTAKNRPKHKHEQNISKN